MSDKLFGTDGVRGKANVYPMTAEFAMKLGMALGKIFKSGAKAVIAKDTRISGDMLEGALSSGLNAMGVNVESLGVMPTPAAAMLTPLLKSDVTIVISASHNPYYDNGIKLIKGDGHKFTDEMTAKAEELVKEDKFDFDPEKIGTVTYNKDALDLYLNSVNKLRNVPLPLSGLKVVLDCANGAFSEIAPKVFKDFGAEVTAIGVSPDGYNINKGCGSTCIDPMVVAVVKNEADIGIAFDGDGDRIIVCDENGKKADGDQLMAFLAGYLSGQHQLKGNTVVATILSNLGLDKYLETLGINMVRAAVGERHVIAEMQKSGSNLGGEEVGHMILSDYSKGGDGMVVGLVVCEALLKSQKKMSQLFPVFTPFPCSEVDTYFENKSDISVAMADADIKTEIEKVKKELGSDGYLIVRKSGTEPLIKVKIMGQDVEKIKHLNQQIRDKFDKYKISKIRVVH